MSVHTFETMGTVVSIRVPDADAPDEAARASLAQCIERARMAFDDLDEKFSLYREASEASRIARGEITLAQSSSDMRDAYAKALEWRTATNYTFTPHRPDDVIDLSGTIKAEGILRAAASLTEGGFDTFLINAGGDMLSAGRPADGWRVGVGDPDEPENLIAVVELTRDYAAMATSGTAERGEHIWRRPDTDTSFRQVSVLAADIMTADVLATTIIAGGQVSLDHSTSVFDIGVLVVKNDGSLLANDKFRTLIRV